MVHRRFRWMVVGVWLLCSLPDGHGDDGNHWTVRFGGERSPAKLQEIELSPDGKLLALTTSENNLHLVRLSDGEQIAMLKATEVKGLRFTKDGKRLLAVSDFQVNVLDGQSLRILQGFDHPNDLKVPAGITLQARGDKVIVASISPNSVASLAGKPPVNSVLQAVIQGEEMDPQKAAHPEDSSLKVKERTMMPAQRMLSGLPGTWIQVRYVAPGASEPESVAIRLGRVMSVGGKPTAICFQSSQGENVSVRVHGDDVVLRHASTGRYLGAIRPRHVGVSGGTRFTREPYLVFAGKYQGRMNRGLEVYDLQTGNRVAEADISLNGIGLGTVHPTRDEVWIPGQDSIEVFNLKERKWNRSVPLFKRSARSQGEWTPPPTGNFAFEVPFKGRCVAVSDDGLVAVGSSDGFVRLLDEASDEFILELPRVEEKGIVEGILFTPGGSHLVYFVHGTLHIAERASLGVK